MHHVFFVLLLCCLTELTNTAAQRVCPDVKPGDKAFRLDVSNNNITLPNGKLLRGLMYNGSYIGPLIAADLGDEVSVDVVNNADVGTSVHWHGMDLPDAAWADGVDTVTQRPIAPGDTFRYKFKAEPAGTLWYHSHVGMQFADGLRGPLIVTDPEDPYNDKYDEEVVLLFTDQSSESADAELKALQQGIASMAMGTCTNISSQDWSDAPFTTILTNGKGFVQDPATRKPVGAPYVLKVQKGKRYRVRTIQGASSWGLKVKAPQGHGMTVIALDGSNVQATPGKGFVFTPGERVDFILHANQSVGNYWMDIATLTGNNSPVLVSYVGAEARTASSPRLSLGCEWALYEPGVLDFKNHTLKPHATVPTPPTKPTATLVVYLTNNADPAQSKSEVLGSKAGILGMQSTAVRPREGCAKLPDGRKSAYCWTLNWVQFEGASNGVPLLFPDAQPGNNTYIQEVPFGAVVDVVLINPGTMLHPMHLHGQRFWVLGAGNGDILTPQGNVDYSKLNTTRAIMRDTQPVANAIPTTTGTNTTMAAKAPPIEASKLSANNTTGSAPRSKAMGAMPGHGRRHLMQPPATPNMPGQSLRGNSMAVATPASAPSSTTTMPAGQDSIGSMGSMGASGSSMGDASPMTERVAMTPGYSVIRFKANNPGMWALHCHIDLHANSGMLMAFKVAAPGAKEPWSLPKGITSCGAQNRSSLIGNDVQANETSAPAAKKPAASSAAAAAPAGVNILLQFTMAFLLTLWMHLLV